MNGMRLLLSLILLATPLRAEVVPYAPDCVILLHGLARSDASLLVLEEALEIEGYRVVNSDYDSAAAQIETLAAQSMPPALEACGDAPRINFVTHSMGGILLRVWAEENAMPSGRTVMLAPPNQGSELVDELEDIPPFDWLNGPAGGQLGTDGLVTTLGPVWDGVGIIAGDRSLTAVYSVLLPGPDDGKVTVASTRVDGMADHLTVGVTHTFMMNSPIVVAQVQRFLDTGAFAEALDLTAAVEALIAD